MAAPLAGRPRPAAARRRGRRPRRGLPGRRLERHPAQPVELDLRGAQRQRPLLRFIVAATAVLLFTVPTAFVIIYLEMKVIALQNLRLGPNRQGPWGVLASTLHGFKVLAKEDFTPTGADVPVFTLAPVVVYLASVMSFLVIPFAPGLFAQDMNLALLYFFAVGGLGVVGLMMAGWSSFNKYSLLGALRAAAQIISYEIPLTLSVVGVIMLAGTLSLNTIVHQQSGSFLDWYVFRQPLAAVIFFIAATAEGEPDAVRPDRGRQRDRGRLRHRVQRHALRLLLLRRVRQRLHPVRPHRDPLPGRLERAAGPHPGVAGARRASRRDRPERPGGRPADRRPGRAADPDRAAGAAVLDALHEAALLAGPRGRLPAASTPSSARRSSSGPPSASTP